MTDELNTQNPMTNRQPKQHRDASFEIPETVDQEPVIRVQNFNLTYTGKRDVTALQDVTLDLPENAMTAILGPSGCGKSTLLKSMNRLHDIKDNVEITGEIRLAGENIYDTETPIPELRKGIGYVPQKPTALPLSIYDNVAYGPRIHGSHSKEALDEIVERYLRKVDLWEEVKDRLDTPGADLSTGQTQRLCLARSLAVEPDVVLCDEVTSSLDPISAAEVEETLSELKREYTLVMVTHSLDQAQRLADYIVFLYLGEVIETAETEEFFENPTQEMTKRFIEGEEYVEVGADHEMVGINPPPGDGD